MKRIWIILISGVIGLSFFSGYLMASKKTKRSDLEMVNTNMLNNFKQENISSFRQKITQVVNEEIAHDDTYHISVYYRSLNDGPWFGINEKEEFTPASLLKVPVAIAYYRAAIAEPEILNRQVLCDSNCAKNNSNQLNSELRDEEKLPTEYLPEKSLRLNESYTIRELIERSLMYSDNQSFYLLVDNMSESAIRQVHGDLGINYPEQSDDFVSVRSYASIFRVLYNASYLPQEASEEILEILARATYNKGLVAGLPEGVLTAHKFGIRTREVGIQLHDCGIVYAKTPYLLCVMSRGDSNLSRLESIISKISKEVYNQNQQSIFISD